ncbi:MAG: 2-isopropylmalate synthase [Spirulina sp.]
MLKEKVFVFDTTLRDGELMPGICFNKTQKLDIARSLESMGVDIIEVGYPGQSAKDFEEVVAVSQQLETATICALAGAKEVEILQAIEAMKEAKKGRIHLYANVKLPDRLRQEQTLQAIQSSIALARNFCDDIEWTAFDATRSPFDFLCQAVETAIARGVKTINIADSLGVAKPEEFSQLIGRLRDRVPHCDRCIISVHCHDDLGFAVDNSLAALDAGARQIECAVNGLGARKGNADLAEIVKGIQERDRFHSQIDPDLLPKVSQFVKDFCLSE